MTKILKVLWVSLVKFPPLCAVLSEPAPAHCGWMYASAKAMLKKMPEVKLGVIVYSYEKKYKRFDIDGIVYYLVPSARIDKATSKQIEFCRKAINDFNPNLIGKATRL